MSVKCNLIKLDPISADKRTKRFGLSAPVSLGPLLLTVDSSRRLSNDSTSGRLECKSLLCGISPGLALQLKY
ncbi:hypothetical protein E2C01_078926 [Portunus trituberculatus]|uniref:Uncharacterized protein n=1 Tax=Portunus trituberculatus TaxID=210409 RepID=A0A5B7IRI1_PORTR|nr:hypothetical protein [Portunus trituberculatus]